MVPIQPGLGFEHLICGKGAKQAAGFGVDLLAKEVVCRGVADIEQEARIQGGDVDQLGRGLRVRPEQEQA